jgi:hypothetical protein
MDVWHWRRKSAATAFFLLLCGNWQGVGAEEKLELPEDFPLWQPSVSLHAGVGYKDNVTLSSFEPQGSGFETLNAEAMLFRLPWNNWEFAGFATATDTRYFDQSTGVDTEQNASASAQLGWFPGKNWKTSATAQYIFINQVMDVSETYGTPVRQQVFGQGVTGKATVRKDFRPWWTELELSLSRYFFREPLDDYWQSGPQLSLGRYYGHQSEVSLSYQITPLLYDTREQVDSLGLPIPDSHLRFLPQSVELAWRHNWDEQRLWRSTTRLVFSLNQDNDSGYFDYTEYRLVEELRFRPASWEFTLRTGVAYYDSPNQIIIPTAPPGYHRTLLDIGLKAERSLSRHWKVYAAYDFARSFSNSATEDYQSNTGSAGVEFTF